MPSNQTIPWDDAYSLGIDIIDTQHKKLFEIVNKLYALDEEHSTKEELKIILYEFSDYMRTHFADEEEYMKSIGFLELNEHKHIHETIIKHLSELIKTPAKLGIIKTKMKVLAKHTLIDHIRYEDIKIKLFEISSQSKQNMTDEEIYELV
ncbi:MAG: hemerythrin family protein [Sulfurimonas sp.]|jgi:hemerythrin